MIVFNMVEIKQGIPHRLGRFGNLSTASMLLLLLLKLKTRGLGEINMIETSSDLSSQTMSNDSTVLISNDSLIMTLLRMMITCCSS